MAAAAGAAPLCPAGGVPLAAAGCAAGAAWAAGEVAASGVTAAGTVWPVTGAVCAAGGAEDGVAGSCAAAIPAGPSNIASVIALIHLDLVNSVRIAVTPAIQVVQNGEIGLQGSGRRLDLLLELL